MLRAFATILMFTLASAAAAQDRYALIIGQDSYQNVEPLRKAVNDARAIGQSLQKLGFKVTLGENLTRRDFVLRVSEFENRIRPGDTAFVFYAGHGVEIEGANYLLPVDVPKVAAQQLGILRDEAISTLGLVERLKARGTRSQIVILDACRENPFRDNTGRSLGSTRSFSRIDAGQGVFVMYSAGLGETALDRLSDGDQDPNSVFTRTLVPLLQDPNLSLVDLAKEMRTRVKTLANTIGHKQTPSYYDEVDGDIFLAKLGGSNPVVTQPQIQIRPPAQQAPAQQAVQQPPVQQQPPAQQQPSQQIANAPPQQELPQRALSASGFIFPDSDRRILSAADVAGLNQQQLRIARNEIYARKGRFFQDQTLTQHFSRFSWYRPFTWEVKLSVVEDANVKYLQGLERPAGR
jgi:uncharacterized caspase-like protein